MDPNGDALTEARLDAEIRAAGLTLAEAERAAMAPLWRENLARRDALRAVRFELDEPTFAALPPRAERAAVLPLGIGAAPADDPGDPCLASAADQAALIAAGRLSSEALVRATLDRIARHDPFLRAFVTLRPEEAIAAARAADEALARGAGRSPIHGLPVAIKDCIAVGGWPMTAGSAAFAGRVPQADSAAVARLRAAGAVILGTTAMHEFGAGPARRDGPLATGRNPWDPALIPGGSSSGSAVALAAGLASLALGTDAAGSARIPAAYCGLVGFKPTFGAVDRTGCAMFVWALDTIGPMARTVTDTTLLTEAVSDLRIGGAALEGGVRGLRLGVLRRYYLDAPDVRDDVRAATEAAFAVLRSAGAEIVDVDMPSIDLNDAVYTTLLSESFAVHEPLLAERSADYSDWFRVQLHAAAVHSAGDHIRARRMQARLVREAQAVLGKVDALVFPGQASPATPFGASFIGALTQPRSRFTRPWNITGFPAAAVPCGLSVEGLPLSLHVVGRPHDEAMVLRVARAFERETPWHRMRPDPSRWTDA